MKKKAQMRKVRASVWARVMVGMMELVVGVMAEVMAVVEMEVAVRALIQKVEPEVALRVVVQVLS